MGVGGRGVEVMVWLNSMFDSRHNPNKVCIEAITTQTYTNFPQYYCG